MFSSANLRGLTAHCRQVSCVLDILVMLSSISSISSPGLQKQSKTASSRHLGCDDANMKVQLLGFAGLRRR